MFNKDYTFILTDSHIDKYEYNLQWHLPEKGSKKYFCQTKQF